MNPPGRLYQPDSNTQTSPQLFEISLVRKLESRTKSVRDAFLLLDADGDGHISPEDLSTVLHNQFGMALTQVQADIICSRFSRDTLVGSKCQDTQRGMGYRQFAEYFNHVSNATLPASQSGSAAAVGFRMEEGNEINDRELPIHLTDDTKRLHLRHQLRQTLSAHSSRTHGGSGMKETTLFLAIDVQRSGKIRMQDFLDWLNSVGMVWDMEKLKLVILGCAPGRDRDNLQQHLFGCNDDGKDKEGEDTGMTEHEFAEFVESLDKD